jgi:hypothetical protein
MSCKRRQGKADHQDAKRTTKGEATTAAFRSALVFLMAWW